MADVDTFDKEDFATFDEMIAGYLGRARELSEEDFTGMELARRLFDAGLISFGQICSVQKAFERLDHTQDMRLEVMPRRKCRVTDKLSTPRRGYAMSARLLSGF